LLFNNPKGAAMDDNTICRVVNISKIFPGVDALKEVSLDIRKGEIHGIIGENGAGMSTLMNVLAGVYQPEKGRMEFDGKTVNFRDPRDAQDHGIAMIYQELSLSRYMSVAENIY
jgi:ABC-type sugar transport system ATPase subunit